MARAVSYMLVLWVALGAACDRKVAGGRADGAEIYAEACARCHGPKGVPEPALRAQLGVRDLTSAELQERLSDAEIRAQIVNGSDNKRMPAFEDTLTDAQLDAVIQHVRSLR